MPIFTSLEDFLEGGVSEVSLPLEPDFSCCICLEEFASSSEKPIAFSICGHIFGLECVRRLIGNTCPMCRAVLWEAPPDDQPSADEDDEDYDEEDENAAHYHEHERTPYDVDDDHERFNSSSADSQDVERHNYSSNSYLHHNDHNYRNHDEHESLSTQTLDAAHDRPLLITVRAAWMAWAWRDSLQVVMAGYYTQRESGGTRVQGDAVEVQLVYVLEQVENDALPEINAWNEQHEGQGWEGHELMEEWMCAVRMTQWMMPETIEMVEMLGEDLLAGWLDREV